MSRRGVALLLIGVGAGIIGAAVIALAYFVWAHHMIIIGIRWRPSSVLLALPFLLVVVGLFLLRRNQHRTQ